LVVLVQVLVQVVVLVLVLVFVPVSCAEHTPPEELKTSLTLLSGLRR